MIITSVETDVSFLGAEGAMPKMWRSKKRESVVSLTGTGTPRPWSCSGRISGRGPGWAGQGICSLLSVGTAWAGQSNSFSNVTHARYRRSQPVGKPSLWNCRDMLPKEAKDWG